MTVGSPWDPLQLRSGAVLRNRFVLAPMTTDSSNIDGTVSDAEVSYIRRRCSNEFGAGITSCAYVHDHGRSWQGIGAAGDQHLASLREAASAFQSSGGLGILQLYDGGRLADPALVSPSDIRAPSAIPSARPGALTPREMTEAEIYDLLESFVRAAVLGKEAGFEGIELHGANHYLIHQFFSPRANRRRDKWGGSVANRMRFPLTLAAVVRDAIGSDMTLGFRINPFESEAEGFTLEGSTELCQLLCIDAVDYVHISMDDFRRNSPMREDRNWMQSRGKLEGRNPITAISEAIDGRCAVVASGGIRDLDDAEAALAAGADLVAVGRASLIDPEWLQKIQKGEPVRAELPATPAEIEADLTIPSRMVEYLLSRPGWLPRESTVSS